MELEELPVDQSAEMNALAQSTLDENITLFEEILERVKFYDACSRNLLRMLDAGEMNEEQFRIVSDMLDQRVDDLALTCQRRAHHLKSYILPKVKAWVNLLDSELTKRTMDRQAKRTR